MKEVARDKLIRNSQAPKIVEAFNPNVAISTHTLARHLIKYKYVEIGKIIRAAIEAELLFVESITNDGKTVYLGLTKWGEEKWMEV